MHEQRVKATALHLRYANKYAKDTTVIYALAKHLRKNIPKPQFLKIGSFADCTVRFCAFVGQQFSRQLVNVEIT